jgi:alkylhydroperoxidase family enzyme
MLDAMYHIDQHAAEFSAAELAALRFAELMTTDAREVSQEVWEALQEHFDDGEIIELAAVIGLFNYLNRFNSALDVEFDPILQRIEADHGRDR